MESITKTKLSREEIAQIVEKAFGREVHSTKEEEMKEGWFNTSYWITLSDRRELVLKISPPPDVKILRYEKDVIRTEVDVLKLFARTDVIPVPEVYYSDFSRNIIPCDYFIMEKLPGTAYNKIKETLPEEVQEKVDIELGQISRAINNIQGTEFGYYGQDDKKRKEWSDAFLLMINDILQDAVEMNVYLTMEYERIRQLITSQLSLLELVEAPCLVHWDLHDGNVLVNDNKIMGIIDCDRALWGDPLIEVYFSPFYDKRSNFLKGYGTTSLDTKEGKVRRVMYNVYLYLILVVESYYRKYSSEHKEWAYGLLRNELNVLENI